MLTRHGWGALLLAVTLAVLGRLFGVIELFVLGAGLIVLVAVAVLWIQSRALSLTVHRRLTPDTLQVGETGRVELLVANTARSGTSPLLLWEPVSGLGGATLRLAPLRPAEATAASYRLPASRRGTVIVGPLHAERRDPFGISVRRLILESSEEIVVLPAHATVAMPTGAAGSGPVGQHLRMRALGRTGTEFHSIREYVEGDDLRQINWRASARTETLKVREVEPDGLRRCTVTLDTAAEEYTEDDFERAVSAAASAIAAGFRAGLQMRVVIGPAIDLRQTTFNDAMRRLADCSMGQTGHQTTALRAPSAEGLGLSIVVSGSAHSAAVAAARRQLSSNDILVVVVCTVAPSASGVFVIDATAATDFATAWTAVMGSGSAAHPSRAAWAMA